tara:strand:+ start:767 stop:2122 length:1356 start_codon:yes stop_codon:yes gene_type:complete
MKILYKYILKEHLYPFLISLVVLLSVLLANFLLKTIDRFLGKGLEIALLIEFIFLNLAWILALAVPMSILLSTLMAFGRMSSDNEILAIRSTGIGFYKLLMPSLLFGMVITILMIYFNNFILPDMNHRARMLSADISKKRPDLDFNIGYFIDAIPDYNFLIEGKEEEKFLDITIFSTKKNNINRTITAKEGTIKTVDEGIILYLNEGVIHELSSINDEYREIYYDKYQILIPIDNLSFKRGRSKVRGDREMTFTMMTKKINSFKEKIERTKSRMNSRIENEFKIKIDKFDTSELINLKLDQYELKLQDSLSVNENVNLGRIKRRIKNIKRGINSDLSLINSYTNSINKYLVEIHKKFSIPFASIVFILIGVPLGIMARGGGFSISAALSLGFFIFYWGFLIAGEEFADRGYLVPAISMWLPNIVLLIFGLLLCWWQSVEQKFTSFNKFKSK